MQRALQLAKRAMGRTFPNPLVGAVVVSEGGIVGEGYHGGAGSPHAEIEAISTAGERARGATLFLNLEPCCHFGKTPPCTDAIISAGIGRVIFSIFDPDARVRGRGAEKLKNHGIEVQAGLCAGEALELNLPYVHRCMTDRPFIILKLAVTLDGALTAAGRSMLTGEESRVRVHELRAATEAIAVGIGTIIADDPVLDRRYYAEKLRPPTRMIFDSRLRFPANHAWLEKGEKVVLYCLENADPGRRSSLEKAGAEVVALEPDPGGFPDLACWIEEISSRGVTSVLVEGGGELATSILGAGLFERLVIFFSPIISGSEGVSWFQQRTSPGWMGSDGLVSTSLEAVGRDIMVVYDRETVTRYLERVTEENRIVHGLD
jgi:diaminohydroxyphosphoribosylaminopyrimidine deaminase/5-amino-6-(5-phosphoribosylamino)uracil reductase